MRTDPRGVHPDDGLFKARAASMAPLPREAIFASLRESGLNAADALALTDEIQREQAAQIRRKGWREIAIGVCFGVGSFLVAASFPPFRNHQGLVILLVGLAGSAMIVSGLLKAMTSDEKYLRR